MKILVLAVLLVLSTTVCKYTYYTERRTSKHNNSHMLSTLACKYQLCTRETLLHTGIYRQREQIQNCHSVNLILYTMT